VGALATVQESQFRCCVKIDDKAITVRLRVVGPGSRNFIVNRADGTKVIGQIVDP
jgi:hypothetical protein